MGQLTKVASAAARYRQMAICLSVLAGFSIAASTMGGTAAAADSAVAAVARSTLARAIEQRFESGLGAAQGEPINPGLSAVHSVYAKSGFEPLWVSPAGVDSRGRELAQALQALSHDGLEPSDYGTARIDELLRASRASELAEIEVLLSLALVSAASDLASGRVQPRAVNPKLYIYPQDVDKGVVLDGARTNEEIAAYVQSFQPSQANYHRLKAALAEYRALAPNHAWARIADGPTLELGVDDPRVAQVRERLEALDDLRISPGAAVTTTTVFDAALAEAVYRFQTRHGLDSDRQVGKDTLAELNISPAQRVGQMLLNMERRRWMPDHFEQRYVFVNLADFNLKVVENIDGRERTIHTTEVVVGKPYHQTPEFSQHIRYLVINPYWNVPVSIARNELLGKFKKDPSYIRSKGYELFDGWSSNASRVDPTTIDWDALTRKNFRYKVRQAPGPTNALGRIKFMFPNPHNILLARHSLPHAVHPHSTRLQSRLHPGKESRHPCPGPVAVADRLAARAGTKRHRDRPTHRRIIGHSGASALGLHNRVGQQGRDGTFPPGYLRP